MKQHYFGIKFFLTSLVIFFAVIVFYFNFDNKPNSGGTMNTLNNLSEKTGPAEDNKSDKSRTTFYSEKISDELKQSMIGKSYSENNYISFDDLSHVVVSYIDFDGNTDVGELVVNCAVADEVVEIFRELYECSYPIEKIRLIDEYDGNDDLSMEDNNTSCFNYRNIDGQDTLSDHGYGLAIDINPLYNPYVRTGMGDRNILPINGQPYADRSINFEHKISAGDACYKIFTNHGWLWGGDWENPVDYQHFYRELTSNDTVQ